MRRDDILLHAELATCRPERAHRQGALEWLIVHNTGGILAIPSPHTVIKHQGMSCPHIGEARPHVWPGCDAPGRGAQYGGHYVEPCCTLSSPLLVMLGSVLLWTPTTWLRHHLSYPSSCSFPYSTFTWTSLAGALSTRNTFLSAACYGSAPVSSVTPLPLLPWEEKTVQQHGSMELQGTWGDMTGGEWCGRDKTYWASNYLQSFLTGQKS